MSSGVLHFTLTMVLEDKCMNGATVFCTNILIYTKGEVEEEQISLVAKVLQKLPDICENKAHEYHLN